MSNQYIGTLQRSFKQAVIHLLETEYGLLGSGRVLGLLAADLQQLAEQFHPPAKHLQSGWLVFTGTKACGGKTHPGQNGGAHQLVTLSWPVLLTEDIQALADLPSGRAGRFTTFTTRSASGRRTRWRRCFLPRDGDRATPEAGLHHADPGG